MTPSVFFFSFFYFISFASDENCANFVCYRKMHNIEGNKGECENSQNGVSECSLKAVSTAFLIIFCNFKLQPTKSVDNVQNTTLEIANELFLFIKNMKIFSLKSLNYFFLFASTKEVMLIFFFAHIFILFFSQQMSVNFWSLLSKTSDLLIFACLRNNYYCDLFLLKLFVPWKKNKINFR